VPGLGGGDAALCAPPGHDRRLGGEAALEDLVPAEEAAPLGDEDLFDAPHEIALELVLVLETLGLHPGLALRAALPLGLIDLVAADMDERPWEEADDLRQDILQEFVRAVVAGAEDVGDRPIASRRHRERPSRAGELGIGRERGFGVAGHLDLRHDRDEAGGGVGDDLADVVLGVKAAVGRRFTGLLGLAGVPVLVFAVDAPSPDFGEARVFLDLDPPALVVGQVPMEGIELVHGEDVDPALDELLRKEVTRTVEHAAAPGEPGPVFDRGAGDTERARPQHRRGPLRGRREELAQGLDAIEEPGRSRGADLDAVRPDVEKIALGAEPSGEVLEAQSDRARAGGRRGRLDGQLVSGGPAQHVAKVRGHVHHLGPSLLDKDPGRAHDQEGSRA